MSRADRHQLTILNNPAYENDEQQPPPYSSVYLVNGNTINNQSSFINDNNNNNNNQENNISFCGNYSQQLVSYDELFQGSNTSNVPFFENLVQNINDIRARNNQSPLLPASELRRKKLAESLNRHFPSSYIKRHMQVVLVVSILLVIFQMYLIEYRIMYSSLASGIWAAAFNMLTFLVSMILCKFVWVFLLFGLSAKDVL